MAYLTESKYGRNGTEMTLSNTGTSYYTGGSKTVATVYGVNVTQSTTGNATGIYDMNGGAWEYVTGYITNSGGNSHRRSYGGGVVAGTETESTKYRTVYPYDSGTSDSEAINYTTAKAIYGDGVYETSTDGSSTTSWHDDCSNFPSSGFPLFVRGGNYSDDARAGVFAFGSDSGVGFSYFGFRVVLAP